MAFWDYGIPLLMIGEQNLLHILIANNVCPCDTTGPSWLIQLVARDEMAAGTAYVLEDTSVNIENVPQEEIERLYDSASIFLPITNII